MESYKIFQTALHWNTRGVKETQEANFLNPECEGNARLNLGDNLMALGRLEEAEEHYRWVERVFRNPRPQDHFMLWRYAQHMLHSYGELWLVRGEYEKAIAYADECIARSEESESRKNIVKGRRLRGQVLQAQGNLGEAESEYLTALRIAERMGNPTQLWKTYAALGDLCKARGRVEDARQAYEKAIATIDKIAKELTDDSLREIFLTSPKVGEIRSKLVDS